MSDKKFKNIDKKILKFYPEPEPEIKPEEKPIYPFTSALKPNDYKELIKQRSEVLKSEINQYNEKRKQKGLEILEADLNLIKLEWITKELDEVGRWYQSNSSTIYQSELDNYSNFLHVFRAKLK